MLQYPETRFAIALAFAGLMLVVIYRDKRSEKTSGRKLKVALDTLSEPVQAADGRWFQFHVNAVECEPPKRRT